VKLCFLLLTASALLAQTPDCSIVPGAKQQGKARDFNNETLYEYMDGNSEGYFLYGFVKMNGVTCVAGGVTMIVDLSEFQSPEHAYGMFTGNLDPRLPVEKIGAGAQVVDRKVILVKGKYFAEIAAEPEGKHGELLRAAAVAWEKKIEGSTTAPAELAWFPKEKLQPGSPRLVPQSLLGMRMLKRGYLAQYEQGKAVVLTEPSAEAARALLEKLKERFSPNAAAQAGDEAFTAEDRYLGRICFFRKGARIGGWTNVPAGEDAAAWARRLASAMP
jgi:transcriptional regulator with XRE-family HTH domain